MSGHDNSFICFGIYSCTFACRSVDNRTGIFSSYISMDCLGSCIPHSGKKNVNKAFDHCRADNVVVIGGDM